MPTCIDDVERELISCLSGGSPALHDVVDSLVGHLLTTVDGYSGRPTDGVLFEWEDTSTSGANAVGMVVLIDGQRVEPLRIRLALDASGSGLASGDVWFGDVDHGGAEFGSKTHRNLVEQFLLDRETEFGWKLHFHRDMNGWSQAAT